MNSPDFVRIAQLAAPVVKKDGRHSLIIFSAMGIATIVYSAFNPEYVSGLLIAGVFFLILGLSLFLVEKYRQPHLMVALVKKKLSIPYTRIPGSNDYFVDVESIVMYSFSGTGQSSIVSSDQEQRLKVSMEIFKSLPPEGEPTMLLFSATKNLLGVVTASYSLVPY